MGKETKLYQRHVADGGLMVDFAGWHMPLHYGSQMKEHEAVRTDAGMFDVSHMSVVDVKGKDANKLVSYLFANNVNKLKSTGKAIYGCMLNHEGGIIDDLITYFISNEHYRVVVNAATTQKDLKWINSIASKYSVTVTHRQDLNIVAVQGPNAIMKLVKAYPDLDDTISQLKPFSCSFVENSDFDDWFIARTGYTGEDGVEIILPDAAVVAFWDNLSKHDVLPIGLGARDTLRLEAGLNLYGQDMDETFNPYESNLAWTVAMQPEDRDFIGRSSLEEINEDHSDKIIGLVLTDRGVIRTGQNVYSGTDKVGLITSGTYSPTLKCSIGLARVSQPVSSSYTVEIRNKQLEAQIVEPPFVKKGKANFKRG